MSYIPTEPLPTEGLAYSLARAIRYGGSDVYKGFQDLSGNQLGAIAASNVTDGRSLGLELDKLLLQEQNAALIAKQTTQAKAALGDVVLSLASTTITASAAVLNLMAAGNIFFDVVARLKTAAGELHSWASFNAAAGVTPGKTTVDADVGLVTYPAALFVNGEMLVRCLMDTNANVSKTHTVGDTHTLTIDVSTFGPLLSGLAPVVFTLTVVA